MPRRLVKWVDRVSPWVYLLLVIISAVVIGILLIVLKDQLDKNKTARVGLCAVRHNFERGIESSQALLDVHPKAKIIEITDENGNILSRFPRALLEAQIARDQETVEALGSVACSDLKVPKVKQRTVTSG